MTPTFSPDLTTAPRGKTVTVTRTIGGKQREFEEFRSEYILAVHPDGMVSQSYWIPPRYTQSGKLLEGNRWSGFNVGSEPIAWAPWPVYEPQSDAGAFAAGKAKGRLASADSAEPPASDFTTTNHFIADVGGEI
jgi:hypothetical protein